MESVRAFQDQQVREAVADHLDRAAEYIRVHGWTQGKMQRPTGEVCAAGSIGKTASNYLFGHVDALARFACYLSVTGQTRLDLDLAGHYSTIATWNDAAERTEEDVTTGLEKAAAWVREQVK